MFLMVGPEGQEPQVNPSNRPLVSRPLCRHPHKEGSREGRSRLVETVTDRDTRKRTEILGYGGRYDKGGREKGDLCPHHWRRTTTVMYL